MSYSNIPIKPWQMSSKLVIYNLCQVCKIIRHRKKRRRPGVAPNLKSVLFLVVGPVRESGSVLLSFLFHTTAVRLSKGVALRPVPGRGRKERVSVEAICVGATRIEAKTSPAPPCFPFRRKVETPFLRTFVTLEQRPTFLI